MIDVKQTVEEYIGKTDWRVAENSNAHYSFGALNKHLAARVSAEYWLEEVYDKKISDAHRNGYFHIHDLSALTVYCCGYSLIDIIKKGVRGVSNIPTSKPAKHFMSLLNQVANLITIYQNEIAGAVAFTSFDTLVAPFIKEDNLSYEEVKQHMQNFIFSINSNSRGGAEPAFSNLSFDLTPPKHLLDEFVIVGAEYLDYTYGDCQKEMDMLNRAFCEVMLEGDANGKPHPYPIPTYNIHDRFDWDNPNNELLWEMTGKYGIPYFTNYINSDMDPSDAMSMCPIGPNEKVLIKSSRGRGLEFSSVGNIYKGNSKQEEYEIYSHGKFVKGRFRQFKDQKMLRVTLVNGHTLDMSEEHLNFVMKNKESDEYVAKGRELRPGEYLPYSLNVYSGHGGSYELGYFVGAFAGDGSFDGDTSVVFSLGEAKEKAGVLDRLKDFAENEFGARTSVYRHEDSKLVTLRVSSKALVGLCKEFVEGKEKEKCYSANVFGMSVPFRKGVLDGHYDTDGGNRYRIYTSSVKMVESLNMLAATLGTTTNVVSDEREGRFGTDPNYTVRIYQFTNECYGDAWFKHGDKVWFKIDKIEEIPSSTAYCFEVENDEPMFTVGTTGILTHNCRLRIDLRELRKRGGGLFGSGEKTGSIGVVTINLPRLAYLSSQLYAEQESAKKHFYHLLEEYMNLAKDSLVVKRKFLQEQLERGLLPAFKEYVGTLDNHFSTIGLVGMNEMCVNLLGCGIKSKAGHKFALEVLDFMREKIADYQEETGDLFNLEATPAESCAYRLAKIDVAEFGDKIYTKGNQDGQAPYYTNSCHLPVDEVEDIMQLVTHQEKLQEKFTGGTVIHLYMNSSIPGETAKKIVRTVCERTRIPYVSISPVYSICPEHKFIHGYNPECPHCGKPTEQYQRITGYIRQISKFNVGKKAEFADRAQLSPELNNVN